MVDVKSLEPIDQHGHLLIASAAVDWLRLKDAAEAAGHQIVISTAYRDFAYQKRLYAQYIIDIATWQREGKLGPKPPPVAIPGRSHHELGTCVDVHVAQQPEFLTWLKQHAASFNFYNTVSVEPWHMEWLPRGK